MTLEISVGISFFSLLLFPEHGDIQNVSYTAQQQTDLSLKNLWKKTPFQTLNWTQAGKST